MLVSLLSVSAFAEPRTERNIQGDFIQGTPFVSLKDGHVSLPGGGSIKTFGEGVGSGPLSSSGFRASADNANIKAPIFADTDHATAGLVTGTNVPDTFSKLNSGKPALRDTVKTAKLQSPVSERLGLDTVDAPTFEKEISDLDALKELFVNGGSGYLTANIEADGVLQVDSNVALNLSGCVLDLGGFNIQVGIGVSFEVYDSGDTVHYFTPDASGLWLLAENGEADNTEAVTGGVICNGSDVNGGAVYCYGGSFTLNGGNIVGCEAIQGGAVFSYAGSVTINGGSILGCLGPEYGGAVFMYGGSFAMNGGTISRCIGRLGGAVYNYQGTFTMKDGVVSCNDAYVGGGVFIDGGSFNMSGGKLNGNAASIEDGFGGAVYNNKGMFKLTDGEISENMAAYGGAVLIANGVFTMDGGVFSGNSAIQGGAVQVGSGSFTLNGGEFCNNTAPFGGAMLTFGKLVMNGGSISDNTANNGGGAVYVCGEFTMNDGALCDNLSYSAGGAVYIDGGSVTMNGGKMTGNQTYYGGAVLVNGGEFTMNDGEITECLAVNEGGAVLLSEGSMSMKGGKISGCKSSYGGAVLSFDKLTVDGGVITGSTATVSGGAIYSEGDLVINDGEISENYAPYGGGIYSYSEDPTEEDPDITVTGGVITGNEANVGGGIFADNIAFELNGGEISGNEAACGGGVLASGGSFTMNDGMLSGNIAGYGGGILIDSCSVTMNGGAISNNFAPYGGGVDIETGSFVMAGGEMTGNKGTYGAAICSFTDCTVEGGVITGNEASAGSAIYCLGELSLTAAPGKQISITNNSAYDAVGGVLSCGSTKLSGKVVIKDNTAAAAPCNLAVYTPVTIIGALDGSEIIVSLLDTETDDFSTGILTSGYSQSNPGAGVNAFFRLEGPDDILLVENNGELEAVGAAAKIGDSFYLTLAAAIEAVGNDGTVALLADNGETVTVGREVSFVLDTNGHAFSGSIVAAAGLGISVEGSTYTVKHIHSFETTYTSDENGHWFASTCGHDVRSGEESHIDGNCDHTCDACGYVMSECHDNDGDGSCDLCGKNVSSVVGHVSFFSKLLSSIRNIFKNIFDALFGWLPFC